MFLIIILILFPFFAFAGGIGDVSKGFILELKEILSLVALFAYFTGILYFLKMLIQLAHHSKYSDGQTTTTTEARPSVVAKNLLIASALLAFGWSIDVLIDTLGADNSQGSGKPAKFQ